MASSRTGARRISIPTQTTAAIAVLLPPGGPKPYRHAQAACQSLAHVMLGELHFKVAVPSDQP
jgi:hypothetical protein